MKKRLMVLIVVLPVLLLVAALVFWWLNRERSQASPVSTPSVSHNGTAKLPNSGSVPARAQPSTYPSATDVAEENQWISAPINFWGKVVDEEGTPIPNASIVYAAMDKPLEQLVRDQGTQFAGKSDGNGLFSLTGIKGAGLNVEVSKEGYYRIEQSSRLLGYGIPNEHKPPAPNTPAVFVLRKMGETEPLTKFSSGGIRVPKDGQPVEVSLTQGRVVPSGQGDIQVEVWTQDQQKDAQRRYPWKCRISVPGGGLVERNDNFAFMAPAEGYELAAEISMDQAAERWQKSFGGQYFAKLKDGTFARFTFNLTTGGNHFFMVESLLNPTPGSRNLEFDPAKVVKPAKQ